jgi:hypothetical protein
MTKLLVELKVRSDFDVLGGDPVRSRDKVEQML